MLARSRLTLFVASGTVALLAIRLLRSTAARALRSRLRILLRLRRGDAGPARSTALEGVAEPLERAADGGDLVAHLLHRRLLLLLHLAEVAKHEAPPVRHAGGRRSAPKSKHPNDHNSLNQTPNN